MVLLCQQEHEAECLEPLYTNRNMNQFFGGGIISKNGKEKAGGSSKNKGMVDLTDIPAKANRKKN